MSHRIETAIARLERQLPIRERQRVLSLVWREAHRRVIESLVRTGQPPARDAIAAWVGPGQVDAVIAALGAADLVVLSPDRQRIVGAYPVTSEDTPHRLMVDGQTVCAMCALDALAVAPLFGVPVQIRSRCRVTGGDIHVQQDGPRIVDARPADAKVGVRWQMPTGAHAAHSMCTEMVFLQDDAAARTWHGGDLDRYSEFSLDEAVEFALGFFAPLMQR